MQGGIQERGKTRFLKYLIFGTDGIADIWSDGKYRYKANVKSYTEKKCEAISELPRAFCFLHSALKCFYIVKYAKT